MKLSAKRIEEILMTILLLTVILMIVVQNKDALRLSQRFLIVVTNALHVKVTLGEC